MTKVAAFYDVTKSDVSLAITLSEWKKRLGFFILTSI